jgi:hypothetical protein
MGVEKWDNYVFNLNKNEINLNEIGDVFEFNINEQSVVEKKQENLDCSIISENIGDFGYLIGIIK